MNKAKLEKIILVGITGKTSNDWQSKFKSIKKLGIIKVALFLEMFPLKQRLEIYNALLASNIKEIPMVHIRDDMSREEIQFLFDNFKSRYFTIHPDHFKVLKNWRGFYKNLYLELGASNKIDKSVKMKKIGGFCVDLSHYQFEAKANMKEADFINKYKGRADKFGCNHLNGYDIKKNSDVHKVKSKKELDYLPELPKFIFSKVIGLEMSNSIEEQLEYKKYIITLLTAKSRHKNNPSK